MANKPAFAVHLLSTDSAGPANAPRPVELSPPRFNARGDSYYEPCLIGLHLCGIATAPGGDHEQPYTALNLPARDHDKAREMFDAARAEATCGKDAADYVCDLNLGSPSVGCEHVADFYTNRQLLPRLIAALAPFYLEQAS